MTKEEIKKLVKSWNWNLNIFEIYDELEKNYQDKKDQRNILKECLSFFNDELSKKFFNELADHLGVDIA